MVEVVATPPVVDVLSSDEQRLRGLAPVQQKPEVPEVKTEAEVPANQSDEDNDPEETEGDEGDGDEEDKKPKKRRRPTFSQLRAEKRAAEAELRALKAEREAERGERPQPKAPEKPAGDGKPKLEQFASYDDYQEALTDWKVDERLKAKEADYTKRTREAKAAEYEAGVKTRFNDSVEKARDKYADYDDVAFSDSLKVSPQMARLIGECDDPAEVAYYLGKNLEKADELAKMSPQRAAVSLGKIEAALSAAIVPPKSTTKAPPPVSTVKGGRAAVPKDPKNMTGDEYYAHRRAQFHPAAKGA